MSNYTFKMSQSDRGEYTVDIMEMYVRGKLVDSRDIVNIHETYSQRCSIVRSQMITAYENGR
jgi:hypothetical protein